MTYKVIIQPPAAQDIEAAYLYIQASSPPAADRWLTGIETAIQSLKRMPKRCSLARESKEFTVAVRQLLFGRRRATYRILFVVQGRQVRVLHVRHSAQRSLNIDEIEW
jgi:plasmid stabilization system protein ParE